MLVHQGKLQNKQAFLFRLVDIANELFAMAASVARAHSMSEQGHPDAHGAGELADLFCRNARRKIGRLFHDLWFNDDVRKYKVALRVLEGKHAWLEKGILPLAARTEAPTPELAAAPVGAPLSAR
jgi:hypothetical protein